MTKFMMTILSLGCTVVLSAATASADQVVLNNGDRLTGRVTGRSATELTIDTELAGRVTVKMSAVSLVTPAPTDATPDAPRWHGTVNAGVDVGRGNTETSAISTNGAVTRLGPRDRFGVFGSHLSSVVGSGADSVTTARATRGGFRYDHDLK